MLSDEERELIKLLKLIDFDNWRWEVGVRESYYISEVNNMAFTVYERGGIMVDGYTYCPAKQ